MDKIAYAILSVGYMFLFFYSLPLLKEIKHAKRIALYLFIVSMFSLIATLIA